MFFHRGHTKVSLAESIWQCARSTFWGLGLKNRGDQIGPYIINIYIYMKYAKTKQKQVDSAGTSGGVEALMFSRLQGR